MEPNQQVMADDNYSNDVPLMVMPISGAVMMKPLMFPEVHNHGPGEYCFFCPCQDCAMFFGRNGAGRVVKPVQPNPPSYGDVGFVLNMRAAAAKREEDSRAAAADYVDAVERAKKFAKEQIKKKHMEHHGN